MVSPSRTLLAMGHYGALPDFLTRLSPRFRTPSAAILTSTLVSSVFYATMRFLSENVLWDTITALGVMICFYYSITAFASVRSEEHTSELQSLMRISYAVFCLKKKNQH